MSRLIRFHRTPLSPLVLFPILWVAAALLSQLHLLNAQSPWSGTLTAVVIVVPIAFVLGGIVGTVLGAKLDLDPGRLFRRPGEKALRAILVVFVLVGLAELCHQFIKIGGIPLIAPDGNEIRFDQGGPSIILINLLTVAGLVAFVRAPSFFSRESFFELAIVTASMAGFVLQAGRGSIALMVVVGVIARWFYRGRPKIWLVYGAGALAFAVLTFGFYLRTRHMPYAPFEAELFGQMLPDVPFILKPLIPVYIAVTTNFYALQQVVATFPDVAPFGGGAYNLIGFDLFVPGTKDISDVSSLISPPWITSTVAGSLWADGGFPAVVVGLVAAGVVSVGTFVIAIRTRTLGWCLAAAYLLYVTVFGLYTNLWTQQIDWMMVTPLLILVGFAADTRRGSPVPATPEPGIPALTWIKMAVLSVALLALSAATVDRLLPEPLPQKATGTIAEVKSADMVMVDGAAGNGPDRLYWITDLAGSGGNRLGLRTRGLSGTGPGDLLFGFRPDGTEPGYLVSSWGEKKRPSLFELNQRRWDLGVTIRQEGRRPARFDATVPREKPGVVRDFAISTWNGPLPDLFVIDRDRERKRMFIRVVSGESGFTRTVLRKTRISGASNTRVWSVAIGDVWSPDGTKTRTRPDLLLIRHDADKKFSDVWLVRGEGNFESVNYQRDIDLPGDVNPESGFLPGRTSAGPVLDAVIPGGEAARKAGVRIERFDLGEFRNAP